MAAIHNFLNYITSKWGRDIPLKNLWTVKFDNLAQISQNVSNILRNTESINSSSRLNRWPVVNFAYDQSYLDGLYVAQSVVLPSDSFAVSNSTNTNMNGLRAGYIGGERTPYTNINIEFLETNTDIIDFLFRPWAIAAAHKGLIEDNDPRTNIKTNIRVELYSRINRDLNREGASTNTWQHRKTYVIEGAVPASVEGDKLKYSNFDISDLVKSVAFTFKNYYVQGDINLSTTPGQMLPADQPSVDVSDSLSRSLIPNFNIRSNNLPQPVPVNTFIF
ncbi:MAG: hypothetical protein EBU90_31260 [Proteobacteria bacterium]|nr:hypothetical protein [Pseudomonadota bacterium]